MGASTFFTGSNIINGQFSFMSIDGSPAIPKPDNEIEPIIGGNGYTVEYLGLRADPFVLDCVAYWSNAYLAARAYEAYTALENELIYYTDKHGVRWGPYLLRDVLEVSKDTVGLNTTGDTSGVQVHTRWTLQYIY